MKHVLLSYSSGKQEQLVTTDASAATAVERFCHEQPIWVEKFAYRNDRFERIDERFVPSGLIARIMVDRDDFLNESNIE